MCEKLASLQPHNFQSWEILVNGTEVTRERVMLDDFFTHGKEPSTLNLSISDSDSTYNIRAVFLYFPCQNMKESHPLPTGETAGAGGSGGASATPIAFATPESANRVTSA